MPISKVFKYSSIGIGLLSILIMAIFSSREVIYLRPIFYIFLFGFYWFSAKKFNLVLLFFMFIVFIEEYLSYLDYFRHFQIITILLAIFYFLGSLLLMPAIRRIEFRKITKSDFYIAAALTVIVPAFVLYIWISSNDEFTKSILFALLVINFLIFIGFCLFIFAFSEHSKRFFLLVAGLGNLLNGVNAVLNELYFQSIVTYMLINIFYLLNMYFFVYFMIHLNESEEKPARYI